MASPLFSLLQKTYYSIGGQGLGRIKPLRKLYEFFFNLLRPKSVMVQGHRIWLDDRDTLELGTHDSYEPMETNLFLKEIRAGDVVLDIGANIGYYTLIAARLVGNGGKVYAFEPDPENFKLLEKNIRENGYTNVSALNKAVSQKNFNSRLFLSETNRGDHRLYNSKDGRKSISVQTIALDKFLNRDKAVQFIKMDIQGAEMAALEGMKGLIRKNRSLKLVTEFWPGGLKRFGSDPSKYLKTLQNLGFKISEISEKNKTIKVVRPLQLLSRYTFENDEYTNLYCVKG